MLVVRLSELSGTITIECPTKKKVAVVLVRVGEETPRGS